ncbi:methyltransferase [Vulcanococcus limneticus]|uniref:methyltransferase n=1 Tax=Vulcanococcus limneticus TaxID=2170428 RepID=UPI000B98C620|nr:methyltransferase [Vulcanococcus limneticus]MCP9791314.1 methyltransferase [Vulcanococcus limneticus MW73D5]MCP9893344.1 methyltransferase [Vulcanococcus limneticus Candia 3F8]MCP9896639.1 methyltransferase [Vulcanococcus limneticus Candia 3B3]
MTSPSPARILEVGMAFWPAKVLLSAVELGLFSSLGTGSLTGPELVEALALHPRANPDFFDTLVALGFLERDGDGEGARYRNTEETGLFLDRAQAGYIGGFLEMANDRLYPFWGDLAEALRTGAPQNEIKASGAPMFEELYAEPERLEQFMAAMSGISAGNFQALAERFDFSPYRSLCDVGGASGLLSTLVARRHPHLHCTTADLPPATAIAARRIAAEGLADRIDAVPLDFFADPLPKADVITMGLILHDWNLEKKLQLVRAAYEALPEGGAFIVVEHLIDDARRSNAFGLMMSLNMLIEFGDAFDFTGADFDRWCREAGFRRTEVIPLGGPASAGVAYK